MEGSLPLYPTPYTLHRSFSPIPNAPCLMPNSQCRMPPTPNPSQEGSSQWAGVATNSQFF
ncbi:MAG: hypothetical protein F6J93_10620 [Oscillatoria sp. SIO1A7]|nr:hypothetical protein [Oscillatoria sp. SIO1A7]